MANAKKGDKVKVHYTGKLKDGTVFDSSVEREPLEFTIGGGGIIPSFEKAVIGMDKGASKKIDIAADDAYGPHHKELIIEVEKDKIPPNIKAEVGQQLQLQQEGGKTTMVVITNVTDANVTLDANHPLAGKDLSFEIELVEIV